MSSKKNIQAENTIPAGYTLDYVSGKQLKETNKELVRQRVVRALIHEYGFSPEDMDLDLSIGGRKKVDVAIFHHGKEHTIENLGRAVICRQEPNVGKNTVRIRDYEQAATDLGELETIMREVDAVQYGLWILGDRGPGHCMRVGAGIAQPLAPARHARRIDRHAMLKVLHAAEVLPVGVFNPHCDHVLVAQVMLILQVMQRHHQPRREARRTLTGMIGAAQSLLKRRPIDAMTQTNQWMAHIDQLLQIYLEQLPLWLLWFAFWPHLFPQKLCRFQRLQGNFISLNVRNHLLL